MIQIDIPMPTCCYECFALDDSGDYPFCLISQDVRGYTFNVRRRRMPTCPLKAQEPRVMTLEEALGEDECWIECRSGACGYGDALISDDGERVEFYRPHSIDTLDFYAYNMVWRCWTARPDEATRGATPWE